MASIDDNQHSNSDLPRIVVANEDSFEIKRLEGQQTQPSLFDADELLVPPAVTQIRKPVAAIHIRPVTAADNPEFNTRRLMDGCILAAQLEARGWDADKLRRLKEESGSPMFEIRIGELARLANIPGKNYQRLYQELDNLIKIQLLWTVLGKDGKEEWAQTSHFLSSWGRGLNGKAGLVRFSLPHDVLMLVLEPSTWATLSCQAHGKISNAATYALYQNAWRYINTAQKVTAALPTETWIELIVGKSKYVSTRADGSKTINYADFKRRTLIPAIREVNELQALAHTLELREFKAGRTGQRIAKLQFAFVPKQQHALSIPLTWPNDLIQVLESIGFTPSEIGAMSQAHPYELAAEAIVKLKAAEVRVQQAGNKIASRKAYFLGILANIAGGATDDDLDHAKLEEEVRQQEAQRVSEERQARLKEEFSRHQTGCVSRWLFGLPDIDRTALLSQFEASEEGERSRILVRTKGWSPNNGAALTILRNWLQRQHPELLAQAFTLPEDRTLEAWLAWRVEAAAG